MGSFEVTGIEVEEDGLVIGVRLYVAEEEGLLRLFEGGGRHLLLGALQRACREVAAELKGAGDEETPY